LNILITGGNGFLGSFLAEKFYNLDYEVSLLVRTESNLNRLQNHLDNYNIFRFSNEIDLKNILIKSSPDIIIHTACNYGRKDESVITIFDANYRFGLLLLNEIILSEKEIVFLNVGTILPSEYNLYSLSKNQFSDFGKLISKNFKNIDFRNILLQHIYGPGDDESKFTSYVINACLKNVKEVNLTAGNQLRDFIYIKDASEAISIICKNISQLNVIDIEVGSGTLISIKDFVLKLHKLTDSTSKLNFGAIKDNSNQIDIPAANLNILNGLNWKPKYNLKRGLTETIKTR
jgi:CDP-paratose synthetase